MPRKRTVELDPALAPLTKGETAAYQAALERTRGAHQAAERMLSAAASQALELVAAHVDDAPQDDPDAVRAWMTLPRTETGYEIARALLAVEGRKAEANRMAALRRGVRA
jgi:hypothetical protein